MFCSHNGSAVGSIFYLPGRRKRKPAAAEFWRNLPCVDRDSCTQPMAGRELRDQTALAFREESLNRRYECANLPPSIKEFFLVQRSDRSTTREAVERSPVAPFGPATKALTYGFVENSCTAWCLGRGNGAGLRDVGCAGPLWLGAFEIANFRGHGRHFAYGAAISLANAGRVAGWRVLAWRDAGGHADARSVFPLASGGLKSEI